MVLPLCHPLVFAVYPCLFLYLRNYPEARLLEAAVASALSLAAAAAIFVLAALGFRDRRAAALLCSYLAIAFFSFGHLAAVAHNWFFFEGIDPRKMIARKLDVYTALSALLVALPLLGAVFIRLRPGFVMPLNRFFSATAAVLLMFIFCNTGRVLPAAFSSGSGAGGAEARAAACPAPFTAPDIYLIVLDGYGREDVLRRFFNHDNNPFLDYLRSKGFEVASESTANYYWTTFSLSSILNLDYLGAPSFEPREANRLIGRSEVARMLNSCGYRSYHVNSTYGPTARNEFADVELGGRRTASSEYYRTLLASSWFAAFDSLLLQDLATSHLASFQALEEVPSRPGPKFVFAHIVLPHHPYLFDKHGSVIRHATVLDQFEIEKRLWDNKAAYIEQLLFVNSAVSRVIDSIVAKSERPPVIVLVSDHGPQLVNGDTRLQRHVRFSNFTACLLPGYRGLLPSDITAVNIFRLVANTYFGANYRLLEPAYFYSCFDKPSEMTKLDFDPGRFRCDFDPGTMICRE